jgi:hypothetical protein
LLDSIRAFRSMLLKVMVAVRRRWLQRSRREEPQSAKGQRECGMEIRTTGDFVAVNELGSVRTERTAEAEENDMNTVELQRILGYSRFSSAVFVNMPVNETA